ncbi:ABC transporter permease [Dyadobacter sandarakinus]|uniref:ABC transporter permease n=1 Tax=Dyadobacter sandarakinus TaxID=2747268 RepID=A0ABX7I2J4_9BACT|nr:ABC transporter permease [Dyadobacter sandarakinus]QRR00090.1 ABC transporter permease [Dyadobacter sandarakinus]
MLQTNLKIAFRNLMKFRVYSFINITGLSLGMAASMLILMFVMHEFSYDRFHQNHKRIYKVFSRLKIGENSMQLNAFPADFAILAKTNSPHVKDYVRMMPAHNRIVISNPAMPDGKFYEQHFLYADPAFFRVFSFKLIQGNPAHALEKLTGVVISQTAARKYFGNADPVGQTLLFQNKHLLEVTAVAADAPSNSSLAFDFVVPLKAFPLLNGTDRSKWAAGGNFNTYLLLDSPGASRAVAKSLNAHVEKHEDASEETFLLESLTDIHLGNNTEGTSNARLIYIFAGIAGLTLALALFNYMSLTTARATLRAREVGVRKVVGSGRGALIRQFYTESVLTCLIAFIIAWVVVEVLRRPFNDLLGLKIDVAFLYSPQFLCFLALLFLISVLLAGSYPALVLSGFAPIVILKGRFSGRSSGAGVRKGFMVFQFATSVALMVCSLVVRQQVGFMQTMKLGFNKDQVMVIPFSETSISKVAAFRDEVAGHAGIKSAAVAASTIFGSYDISFEKNAKTKKDIALMVMAVDRHFVETLGLQWKLAPEPGTLQNRPHVLLNELAVKELGLGSNVLGKTLPDFDEVAGVLQNFYFTTPQGGIKPVALVVKTDTASLGKSVGASGALYVRIDPQTDSKAKVKTVEGLFSTYYPDRPFEYHFLDEAFTKNFRTEIRMSQLFSVFTGLAIFIACMGLFGLVTFTAETRVKEIGIRKVLGASVSSIVALLSADFLKLVTLSIVFALPLAWYFMEKWLQDFTYRIQIPWWIYLSASLAAILIAIATMSFQSIKAALMNPVKSLRSD